MRKVQCECGHEKADHLRPTRGTSSYGACRVCLCAAFQKPNPANAARALWEHYSAKVASQA